MWARGTVTWSVHTGSATCHDALGKAAYQNWSSVLCVGQFSQRGQFSQDEKLAEGPGDAGAVVARKVRLRTLPSPSFIIVNGGYHAGPARAADSPVGEMGFSRKREPWLSRDEMLGRAPVGARQWAISRNLRQFLACTPQERHGKNPFF
jgi:hypothetical protein